MSTFPDARRDDLRRMARHVAEPFPHFEFDAVAFIPGGSVAELVDSFPERLMLGAKLRGAGSDKSYLVDHRGVFDHGSWLIEPDRLPGPWHRLLSYLTSSEYSDAVRALLGLGDAKVRIEVRLSSYPSGGWMSRHTDRPDKLFSHNIYLCPEWNTEWGGGLALYATAQCEQPVRIVCPGPGNSVLFARSDSSWHEVMAVSASAARPRRAVLIHGYHSDC